MLCILLQLNKRQQNAPLSIAILFLHSTNQGGGNTPLANFGHMNIILLHLLKFDFSDGDVGERSEYLYG